MDERREKGICFNCDNKYSKGNKCNENKLFYIDCGEEEDRVPKPTMLASFNIVKVVSLHQWCWLQKGMVYGISV
jgi:hypothetical protein